MDTGHLKFKPVVAIVDNKYRSTLQKGTMISSEMVITLSEFPPNVSTTMHSAGALIVET